MLIERGHPPADVRNYTLRQLRAFSEAAERARRRDLVDQATIARAAAMPDPEAYQLIVKKLGE